MNKENTIKKIKEFFLTELVKLNRDEDRIKLYDKIIKLAKDAELESYTLCFEGFKAHLKKEYDKGIEFFIQTVAIDETFLYPYIGLGNIYFDKESYDEAINNYNKAINIDNTNATPKYNLGLIYTEKQEYNEAIKYFKESIDIDNTNIYQWNDLGNAYLNIEDYTEAIICYKNSIKLDDKFPYPWYGLGNVYLDLNNYKESIISFMKAIELNDKFSDSWFGAGNVYFKTKLYEESIEYFEKAIELDDKDIYKNQKTNELLEKIRISTKSAASVKSISENGNRIGRILEKTANIFKYSENKKSEFLDFIQEEKIKSTDSEYNLEVLRRWNSYTPIVANDYHISKGGGYFIKAGGYGIVIDPGFNFIDNFKGAGHNFNEIDVVIISHAHNDHTADLESILTLLYKYNDNIKKSDDPLKEDTIYRIIEKKQIENKEDINKEIRPKDIEDEFDKSGRRKIINIFMPQSVFKKHGGLFDLFERADYRPRIIEKGRTGIELLPDCPLKMDVLTAKHYDILSDYSSVGMVLYTDNSAIVYTGDTGWSNDIEKEYKDIAESIKDKKSVLIAHLGGFKEYENEYAKYVLEEDFCKQEKSYYKNHLGRIGVAKVAEIIKPTLCLISEFGEEFKGRRQEIAEIYNDAFNIKDNTEDNINIKFLPADIGLIYHLEDSITDKKDKVKAIQNIDIDNYKTPLVEDNYAFVDKDKIETILLRDDYSLHYYHKDLVKPEELIQILQKEYRDSIK